MNYRYYSFFAIMRMSIMNKQLSFTAPGNKSVYKVLLLLREKGLISGFSLDFSNNYLGYPRYKVFNKYSYLGFPVIKKIDCYKATRSNFTPLSKVKLANNNYYIINSTSGFNIITNVSRWPRSANLIAKFKV